MRLFFERIAGSAAGDHPAASGADRYLVALVVASAISSLLSFYSLGFVYQVLLACSVFLLAGRRIAPQPLPGLLMALFAANLVTICIASILYDEQLAQIVTVVVRYWGPVLFVCVLISAQISLSDFYFRSWYRLLLVLTAVAYAQYFFSPSLWGLIPADFSTLTEWSEGKSFLEYAAFYRATSSLGSPQVWGLYSAISIVILADRLKSRIPALVLAFLWGGALLSGNKTSGVILLGFLAPRLARKPAYLILLVGAPLLVYLFGGFDDLFEFRALEHIFNFSDIADQEKEGRLAIWAYVFQHISLVFGGGASFVKNLAEVHHFVAESYLLQSWAEATIIFPVVFLFLLGRLIWMRAPEYRLLGLLLLIATTSSHAFSHPAFLVVWPVLAMLPSKKEV